MSSNVGLPTPRGSGTSGYVQRNLSHLRYPDRKLDIYGGQNDLYNDDNVVARKSIYKEIDPEIAEHERRRKLENKVFELQVQLEDDGELSDAAIEERCNALRAKLESEAAKSLPVDSDKKPGDRDLNLSKRHNLVHIKQRECQRMRDAFGLTDEPNGNPKDSL